MTNIFYQHKHFFFLEKLNVRIVGSGQITGVLGDADKARIKKLQEENKKSITIPRRQEFIIMKIKKLCKGRKDVKMTKLKKSFVFR